MTKQQIFKASHKLAAHKTDNSAISYRLALSISLKEIYAKAKKEATKKVYNLAAIVAAFNNEKGLHSYTEDKKIFGRYRGKSNEYFVWENGQFIVNINCQWVESLISELV